MFFIEVLGKIFKFLLIVLIFIFDIFAKWILIAFLLIALFMGNFWINKESLRAELENEYGVIQKMKVYTNTYSDSKITIFVKNKEHSLCIDSDIFFDYEIRYCEH